MFQSTDSPIFDYNSSIHKSFQVKCILANDYDELRKLKDPILIRTKCKIFIFKYIFKFNLITIKIFKAIHIGTIYTSNLDESLNQVRKTIDMLIGVSY